MDTLCSFQGTRRRRLLLVFPKYAKSFGTFDHAFSLLDVRAFMPPQGILVLAALLPNQWEVRFRDENVQAAFAEDFQWADAVFLSGMHVQRRQIEELNDRAHRAGKVTVLGGPSVSAAPEFYPEIDLLHCGEVGDGTLSLLAHLDSTVSRPRNQLLFRSRQRLPLSDFPCPRYDLIRAKQYLTGSIQFSSGCPFSCEFCDIPALYGRAPRLKSPTQVINELEQLRAAGMEAVYFVDDNFIADPRAAQELLPCLAQWQQQRGYPLRLSCEASLNLSLHAPILEGMRQAGFVTVFCGTETPEPAALRAIKKTQNLRRPILESIQTLNRYGLEVASGIILGFDTDTAQTPQAIVDFAFASQIPLLTVNLLYALPKTPLYERLKQQDRIVDDPNRDSNIVFLEPHETVVERWRQVVGRLYEPTRLYERFQTQTLSTYGNRCLRGNAWKRLTLRRLGRAVPVLGRIIWQIGLRSHYRRVFWNMFWRQLCRGQIETFIHIAVVGHHLITYARLAVGGKMQASHYSLQTPQG